MIPRKGDLHDYWRDISTYGDFLGPPPFYTLIRDPVLRLFHRMMAHSIAGRSQAPEKVTVTDLFYLRGLDVGSGLTVIAPELPVIDIGELVRLLICDQIDDTWAWVALGPERQPDAMASALEAAEDAPAVDEGDQAVLAPLQAPQHSMGLSEGAHLRHSRDAPDRGLARPVVTPLKMCRSGNMSGALLHNTKTQDTRERPLNVSFEK
ncbi:hypothetical protein Tco_0992088 [Tanacetum coccineum]|uniref:Uncharacterized protein n=1 Tax=Tanacetum coccineum TaxID=301880 RepID=A0ABQ5F270_9ASTR